MSAPQVSVVLPTYNRPQYLRPAVNSVFAQTFSDWELIIADDGSEGETARYVASLVDPPRVTLMRLPHTGNPGTVRNAAVQAARGEYIAFLDSDDVWLPDKLALQVGSLRTRPERGWSHTAVTLIDDSGRLLTGARARLFPAAEGWILERLIKMTIVVAIPSVMVRRRLLEQVGSFDPGQRMCEDYDLWLRLAAVSEIDGVRETLVHVRSHGQHFNTYAVVLEDRARALGKLLAGAADQGLRPILQRERAKIAVDLARFQALNGGRWLALRTLAKSSQYSLGYPEWWLGSAGAAARAAAPASMLRIARYLRGRSRTV